jgi:hypothetical protein
VEDTSNSLVIDMKQMMATQTAPKQKTYLEPVPPFLLMLNMKQRISWDIQDEET